MHRSALKLWPLMVLALVVCSGCFEKKPPAPVQSQDAAVGRQNHEEAAAARGSSEPSGPAVSSEITKALPSASAAKEETGKNVAATLPADSANNETVTPAPPVTDSPKSAVKPPGPPRPFDEAAFITGNPVGLIVIHPQQFFSSPVGQLLKEFGVDQQPSRWTSLVQKMNLRLADVERITIVMDQSFVNSMAQDFGLQVSEVSSDRPRPRAQLMSLRQIGLGFHNYHDVFSKFPRADGDGEGKKTGLSWRVHLLPFIDQGALYNQFDFNEPWDSERNRALIAKMPELFKSPDVAEEGKTSLHVFTGPNTAFDGDGGVSIAKVTDGTSNTILVALAGPDTADIWTKPGGLDVDLKAPRKSLGKLEGNTFLALMFDGAVASIPSDIDDSELARLIQPDDGAPVDINHLHGGKPGAAPPSLILKLPVAVNQGQFINGVIDQPIVTAFEDQAIHHDDRLAVWFPDDRTVALGTIESVKGMVSAARVAPKNAALADKLRLDSHLTAVLELESQSALIREIAKWNSMIGMVNNIRTITLHSSANIEESAPLIDVELKTHDPQMAVGLSTMAEVGLNQLRQSYQNHPLRSTANDSDREMRTLINRLLAASKIVVDGDKIQFRVIAPAGIDRVPTLLRPTLAAMVEGGQWRQPTLALQQLGKAFHHFHEAYNTFPGAGRIHSSRPVGLSWRVYLLPFLDHAQLYQQFKLDEPWDSKHNKRLIEKMPDVFRSPDVNEPGKTSIHIFTSKGTPFADDQTPNLREILDGSSNTILAVLAGPDTADIWTKPGGLTFETDNPVRSLGALPWDSFLALFFDGDVKKIEKDVKAEKMRRMIQHNDGKPLESPTSR